MTELPYERLPDPPDALTGRAVMVRLVDGLGFRYRWATDGLAGIDPAFRPGEGSMSLTELLAHVLELAEWVLKHLSAPSSRQETRDIDTLRRDTLQCLTEIREQVLSMSDEAMLAVTVEARSGTGSCWNLINGPLADALTHVGQINAWRRLAGCPAPGANVFLGRPPADTSP
jgi:hypothetical protein